MPSSPTAGNPLVHPFSPCGCNDRAHEELLAIGPGVVTAPSFTRHAAQLDRRERRRLLFATIAKSTLVSVAMLGVYFVLPFDGILSTKSLMILVLGIAALGWVLVYQVKAIMRDEHPNLRATQAFGIAIPLLVVVFASAYLVMSQVNETNFSTPLSRVSALYFTITVLATVGFGDIVPKSDYARMVT